MPRDLRLYEPVGQPLRGSQAHGTSGTCLILPPDYYFFFPQHGKCSVFIVLTLMSISTEGRIRLSPPLSSDGSAADSFEPETR